MTTELTGLRARLHAPGTLTSVLLTIPSAAVAGVLGRSGADYVIIDAEHGAFTLESMRQCVEALQAVSATVVIRVAGHDDVLIKQALDLGVDGVQIPTVHTAEQAHAAVSASRYPPLGHRGVGFGRASGYGNTTAEYVAGANGSIAVIMMVESGQGLENVGEIAAVGGIDGLVVGPADLAADLGVSVGDERMSQAYHRVIDAGVANGVKVAVGGPIEDVTRWADAGAELFLYYIDGPELGRSAQNSVDAVARALASRTAA